MKNLLILFFIIGIINLTACHTSEKKNDSEPMYSDASCADFCALNDKAAEVDQSTGDCSCR